MRKQFLADDTIYFPPWVEPPTPCRTRTFSTVFAGMRHGAVRREATFLNRPTHVAKRTDMPGYFTAWGAE